MFNMKQAVTSYAQLSIENNVSNATPHQLILMLYEAAKIAVSNAKLHMQQKNIAAKGEAISKAISIIEEGLRASLDLKVGGELAQNLDTLYIYICRRLVEANIKNDVTILDEVGSLLTGLHDAWQTIRPTANESVTNQAQTALSE